jgi:hypothetical protein
MKIVRHLRVLLLASALTGCNAIDAVKDGMAHAQEVATDMEQAVGAKPTVGFNWINGDLSTVNITFADALPKMPVEQIVQLGRAAAARRFHQAPAHLVVSFMVAGQ